MPITLDRIESFHVGGEILRVEGIPPLVTARTPGSPPQPLDMNGRHAVGQMYAQLYVQSAPVIEVPVVLMHGGGMTGASWESTPDGREGWLQQLLRSGFNVCVCDAFERGRASSPPTPEVLWERPQHRPLEDIWQTCRIGPPLGDRAADREFAFPGTRFPVEHMDQLLKQFVPRWSGTEPRAIAAYEALLDRLGPAILVGHSQGGYFALECAQRRPDSVKAVAVLEPPTAPANPHAAMPHLFVWGDHIAPASTWDANRKQVSVYAQALAGRGASVQWLDLPQGGVTGNSHMLIVDDNSAWIATQVMDWLLHVEGANSHRPGAAVRAH